LLKQAVGFEDRYCQFPLTVVASDEDWAREIGVKRSWQQKQWKTCSALPSTLDAAFTTTSSHRLIRVRVARLGLRFIVTALSTVMVDQRRQIRYQAVQE